MNTSVEFMLSKEHEFAFHMGRAARISWYGNQSYPLNGMFSTSLVKAARLISPDEQPHYFINRLGGVLSARDKFLEMVWEMNAYCGYGDACFCHEARKPVTEKIQMNLF